MKKYLIFVSLIVISLSFLAGCGEPEKPRDYSQSNSKVVDDVTLDERSTGWLYATDEIQKLYSIDNVKIKDNEENFHVRRLPDDESPDGSEKYKNLYNANGNFTWKDKIYHFSMLYSLTDDTHYKVLSLYSDYDKDKVINVPLQSELD